MLLCCFQLSSSLLTCMFVIYIYIYPRVFVPLFSSPDYSNCSHGRRQRPSFCTISPSDMSRRASTCLSPRPTAIHSYFLKNTTRLAFSVSGNERESHCLVYKTNIPDVGWDRICLGIWCALQNTLTDEKSGMYVCCVFRKIEMPPVQKSNSTFSLI